MPRDPDLVDDLREVAEAEGRFATAIASLSDDDARRASLLPGWSVGHLLTHVARNADSHVRRVEAATGHEVVEQYEGGSAGRAAQIEAGAHRSAAELVEDVRASSAALVAAWRAAPDEGWDALSRDVGGRERRLRDLPSRRWQELEVHQVDLGLDRGPTIRDWPDAFVARWLPRMRASLPSRLPPGFPLPDTGALDQRDELAWLYNRLRLVGLPELAPWS